MKNQTNKPSKAQEVMEDIANTIITSIESGLVEGKWQKPWIGRGNLADGIPLNAITRKNYGGGNVVYLWIVGWQAGYSTNEWATYKQWSSIDAQVRKGEHGTRVIKWIPKVCKDHGPDEMCTKCGKMLPYSFVVFNSDQVDGYEPPAKKAQEEFEPLNEDKRIERIDKFFGSLGSTFTEKACDVAAYSPSLDEIMMPMFADFVDAGSYYSTLAHEHVHWTGAKSRLNRDLSGRFGDDAYAAEELVAELGSAMLCGLLGIEDRPRDDHAQYLQHWVRILRDDYKKLWTAASQATKAVEFVQELAKTDELQPA